MRVEKIDTLGTKDNLHGYSINMTPQFQSNVPFNKDKEFDILYAYGGAIPALEAASESAANSAWNHDSEFNWRSRVPNGISADGIPEGLYLSPESLNIQFSYQHETEKAINAVIEKGTAGLTKKIGNVLEAVRSTQAIMGNFKEGAEASADPGKYVSGYNELLSWKGSSALTVDEINLNFYFGQAGVFDAYREVVLPILTIASLNTATVDGNLMNGPLPTTPYMVQKFVAELGGGLLSSSDSESLDTSSEESSASAGGLSGLASSILTATYSAYSAAAEEVLKEARLFSFRMGRAIWGPCFVNNVSWSFDFSEVDDKGFPTKGSVSLKDIKKLTTIRASDIAVFAHNAGHRSGLAFDYSSTHPKI